MLYYIRKIIDVEQFQVTCLFNTGEIRQIDLSVKLRRLAAKSPMLFAKLLDTGYFQTVDLDSYGALCWKNNVDFCPDVLYKMSKGVKNYHGKNRKKQ